MGYVAVKGGAAAIDQAETFCRLRRIAGGSPVLETRQIREQLHGAVDRVMGEGSLYAPDLAALAFKQAAGDTFEAAFILRSYRTTLPRLGYSEALSTDGMRVVRRISAAFKDIPGGQVLGPTPDYTLRLLDFELCGESGKQVRRRIRELIEKMLGQTRGLDPLPDTFPKVVAMLRREGLLVPAKPVNAAGACPPQGAAGADPDQARCCGADCEPSDITRQAITFPAPRSAQLQSLTRGETGGLLALAYSNMRGYGSVHPVIGELRVGYLPLPFKNPASGAVEIIGEVLATEAEVIARLGQDDDHEQAMFSLGYGLCFGHNEIKAIAMAVLDRAISSGGEPGAPSEDQEFVLTHVDGIESMGFCNHYKLPHYVTFQSDLDRLRNIQAQRNVSKDIGQ